MSPRTLLAAGLALSLAGCTLTDRRTDPAILPQTALIAGDFLTFQVTAPSGARANLRIDGDDAGSVQVNAPISIRADEFTEGLHTLRVTVFDGPYPGKVLERAFLVDHTPPVISAAPVAPFTVAPDPLRVVLTFSRDTFPAQDLARFVDDLGQPLPTSVEIQSEETATATLLAPLERSRQVTLIYGAHDFAGNEALVESYPSWRAAASPFSLPLGLIGNQSLTVPVALAPGWTGPTGPAVVLLCSTDPFRVPTSQLRCDQRPLLTAPGEVVFDTTGLDDGDYLVTVRQAGLQDAAPRTVNVYHPLLGADVIPERAAVNGPVVLRVEGSGDVPAALEILAGDTVIGVAAQVPRQGAFTTLVTWDAAVADGTYPLTLRAEGWRIVPTAVRSVAVDRTPPACTGATPAVLDHWAGDLPTVRLSENVTGAARLLVDGVEAAARSLAQPYSILDFFPALGTPATSDATISFDLSDLRDAAGNAATPCLATVAVPVWHMRSGAGALAIDDGPLAVKEAVALRTPSGDELYFVDLDGRLVTGGIGTFLPTSVHGTAGATVSGLHLVREIEVFGFPGSSRIDWTEELGGTRSFWSAPVVFSSPTSIAADPTSSPRRYGASLGSPAWTQATATGREVVLAGAPGFPPGPFAPAAGSPADAVLDCFPLQPSQSCSWALGWIDGSGAVPQVALAFQPAAPFGDPPAPWVEVSATLNVDPAQPASAPALFGRHLAWVEGGLIRAGRLDAAGTGFIHDDPASAAGARLPTFLPWHPAAGAPGPELLWVEPGPSGDVIAARRWVEGSGWTTLPPVNGGVAGEVRTLATAGSMVTWTDAAGHVFARRLNR